ncbi:sal-like protein 4 [Hyalella azteca]|uniref:Sal-like protein 4 n=1 Tax=Hyalella azteca TaxID=294128 RepID=A0A979FTC6_HYAAZ|nr:sal-like protein 4 [Hyalella azteca]
MIRLRSDSSTANSCLGVHDGSSATSRAAWHRSASLPLGVLAGGMPKFNSASLPIVPRPKKSIISDSSEAKSFVCTFCSYQTNVKTNFRVHLRTHTGEKPYECPYPQCTYRSSHKSNLKPHMLRHQAQSPTNMRYNLSTNVDATLDYSLAAQSLMDINSSQPSKTSQVYTSCTSSYVTAGPPGVPYEGDQLYSIFASSSDASNILSKACLPADVPSQSFQLSATVGTSSSVATESVGEPICLLGTSPTQPEYSNYSESQEKSE